MKNRIQRLAASALMLLSSAAFGVSEGQPAPAFELPGSDGQIHRLEDLRGKWVVVAFFPKAFTSG